MPRIQCTCGRQIEVREAQAGTVVECACGLEVTVPGLRALRDQLNDSATHWAAAPQTSHDQDENAPAPDQSERRFLVFLTHPQALPNRISFDAASHFVTACDRLIQAFFSEAEHPWDGDIQVSMALLPNGKSLVEIQTQPTALPDQVAAALIEQLQELPNPQIVFGPVAFAIRRPVREGAPAAPSFEIPFQSFIQQPGDLDQMLMVAGGLASPESTEAPRNIWLHKIWTWLTELFAKCRFTAGRFTAGRFTAGLFGGGPPHVEQLAPDDVELPPLSPRELEIAAAIESESLDQVNACLERYPDATALYHGLGVLLMKENQSTEAIAAYTQLLQLDPHDATAYAARGRAHCVAGSMQNGLADYSQAIEENPEDPECRAARAMLYLELEAWAVAESDLTAAIRHAPIQPQLYVERARARYAQDQTADALRDLGRSLELDPYYVDAHMLSGWIMQHLPEATLQDIVQAAEHFSRAIEIEPDNPAYLVQRAEAYASQSKYALTIDDCDQALRIDAKNGVAFGIRGYAHQQLDNLAETIADCTKAIELGLQSAAVFVSRAVGYAAKGELDQALSDCDTAIELAPDYAAAFNYRGMLRLQQGDIESATEDFAEASRLAPTWSTPREYRADAHRMQAEFEQAISHYTETIELEPDNLTAYIGRALAWMEEQEFDKAWEDLTQALSLDEECVPAYFHRAELSMRREQFEQALEDLDQALTLDADFAPAYHARAQTYLQLKRNEEAIQDFSRLIELHPTWPGAYVGRANAWIHLGEANKASDDYQEAANLDPGATEELMVHRLVVEAHHLHQQEDFEQAIGKATEAIDLDSRSLPAFATRAASYWYAEHFVEAMEDYSTLIELDEETPFAYVGRGQVYVELGEYELAMADLNKAVTMQRQASSEAGLAYALSGRALAHAGLQNFEQAHKDFDESIELRPDNAWVHYNRGLVFHMLDDKERAAESFRQALRRQDPQLTKRKRERAEAFLKPFDA